MPRSGRPCFPPRRRHGSGPGHAHRGGRKRSVAGRDGPCRAGEWRPRRRSSRLGRGGSRRRRARRPARPSRRPPATSARCRPLPAAWPKPTRPAATPTAAGAQCPSPKLNAVLADVAERFGAVTVVAGHQLTTANHVPGSSREKLHQDCMADFRPDRTRIDEIKTYLRSRPEIGGVDSYRDGVVHMDLGGTAVASRRASTIAARRLGAAARPCRPPARRCSAAPPRRLPGHDAF